VPVQNKSSELINSVIQFVVFNIQQGERGGVVTAIPPRGGRGCFSRFWRGNGVGGMGVAGSLGFGGNGVAGTLGLGVGG